MSFYDIWNNQAQEAQPMAFNEANQASFPTLYHAAKYANTPYASAQYGMPVAPPQNTQATPVAQQSTPNYGGSSAYPDYATSYNGPSYSADGYENPADAASPYLGQLAGIGKKYYTPFIDNGFNDYADNKQQYENLYNIYGKDAPTRNPMPAAYNNMANDPTAFINEIMRNYVPSEGYKFNQDQMMKAARNSAAQGGFAGTPNAQMQQAQMIQGLLGNDQQQWLSNILGIQGSGMQGQEREADRKSAWDLALMGGKERALQNRIQGNRESYGYGYDASKNLADYLGNALMSQAANASQGVSNRNAFGNRQSMMDAQSGGDMFGSLLNMGMGMLGGGSPLSGLGGLLGGGDALGGIGDILGGLF